MKTVHFVKACGLGNDFVILFNEEISPLQVKSLSNRRYGIGCDQVITIDTRQNIPFIRFFNPDGSESYTCGNGTRCVALLLGSPQVQTTKNIIDCLCTEDQVSINMGKAEIFDLNLPLRAIQIHPIGVDIGNPHAVYITTDIKELDLPTLGPVVEKHPIFPHRTNVEAVSVKSDTHLEIHIWERGTGITPACGSGATASFAACHSKGLLKDWAKISMLGGDVTVEKKQDNLWLTGEATLLYEGFIDI
ncbi:MAG TPA: diaminopimelate epimerase [Alphaproteobacteria bacterium]|nr:diaminopimelate epimerase [Alphaproteobacteria bacterium]